MPKPKVHQVPPSERIATSFKELKSLSPDLHSAARELSKTINNFSDKLEPLDLGVSAWANIAAGEDDQSGYYWSRSVGYTKLGHKWGIALRQASGNHNDAEYDETVWKFSEAPHWMVIESIAKLPDLFETLIERVKDTIIKLKARTKQANELAAALDAAAKEQAAEGVEA
jgi:hypothetical protein